MTDETAPPPVPAPTQGDITAAIDTLARAAYHGLRLYQTVGRALYINLSWTDFEDEMIRQWGLNVRSRLRQIEREQVGYNDE